MASSMYMAEQEEWMYSENITHGVSIVFNEQRKIKEVNYNTLANNIRKHKMKL